MAQRAEINSHIECVLLNDLRADAAIVAATRISGICFGVICSVALSVVVFPKVGAAPQPLLLSQPSHF